MRNPSKGQFQTVVLNPWIISTSSSPPSASSSTSMGPRDLTFFLGFRNMDIFTGLKLIISQSQMVGSILKAVENILHEGGGKGRGGWKKSTQIQALLCWVKIIRSLFWIKIVNIFMSVLRFFTASGDTLQLTNAITKNNRKFNNKGFKKKKKWLERSHNHLIECLQVLITANHLLASCQAVFILIFTGRASFYHHLATKPETINQKCRNNTMKKNAYTRYLWVKNK